MSTKELAVQLTAALVSGALRDAVSKDTDEAHFVQTVTSTWKVYQNIKGLLEAEGGGNSN